MTGLVKGRASTPLLLAIGLLILTGGVGWSLWESARVEERRAIWASKQAALAYERTVLHEEGLRIRAIGDEVDRRRRDMVRAVLVHDALATDRGSRTTAIEVLTLDSLRDVHAAGLRSYKSWDADLDSREHMLSMIRP